MTDTDRATQIIKAWQQCQPHAFNDLQPHANALTDLRNAISNALASERQAALAAHLDYFIRRAAYDVDDLLDWRTAIAYCLRHSDHLNQWEFKFLVDINDRAELTDGQRGKLLAMVRTVQLALVD